MKILSKHSRSEVHRLLNRSYESVYSRLLEILSVDEILLFANVQSRKTEMLWFVNSSVDYVSYGALSEGDKDEISDILQTLKESILPKLQKDAELQSIAKQLLTVPSASDIYVGKKPNGELLVILTKWACEAVRGEKSIDPLEIIVNRPKSDHFPATVSIRYSDGSLYANMPFVFQYKDRIKDFKTNQNGDYSLGQLKNEVLFAILSSADNPETIHNFVMNGEQKIYSVVFPYKINFEVQVIDQTGEIVPDVNLYVNYEAYQGRRTTNEVGVFSLSNVVLGDDTLVLKEANNQDNQQSFSLTNETTKIVFEVHRKYFANALIKVIDEDDEPVKGCNLLVNIEEHSRAQITNNEGVVDLGQLEVGQKVTVTDGKEEQNTKEYFVEKENNEFVLKIIKPVIPNIQVKLINHKNETLSAIPMDFQAGTTEHKAVTDENGICQFSQGTFADKGKVNIRVHTKKKNGRNKIYKKSIKFDKNKLEYVVKLKRHNWLWLLLLLLPLLLLVQCEKDITLETLDVNTKNPVPDTEVNLAYTRYALFDFGTKKFFTADTFSYQKITDASGQATFAGLSYTWYSAVLKRNTIANISAFSKCHSADNQNSKFHSLKKNKVVTLLLEPTTVDLDFLVVDKEDNQPLPMADVVIETEFDGIKKLDSLKTTADGRVFFKKLPKCGKIKVVGNLKGYYSDSIINKTIEELSKGKVDSTRKLELVPIRKKITFFVKDCKTGEPIASGAVATIHLENANNSKLDKVFPNINGVGKGDYDDIHIINKIRIDVRKKYYTDGVWDKGLTVEEFIALPDSARVICLEPEQNTLDFTNIDEHTKQPLPGVTNIVTIKSKKTTRIDTIMSNINGSFSAPNLVFGDKITICSNLDPYYEPNTTTIVNKNVIALSEGNAKDRVIPLTPKEFTLNFQVFDSDVDTLVNDATLQITLDGQIIKLTNSRNGKFQVKGYYYSVISIIAEKSSYTKNDTKIKQASFNDLISAPQSERNIPLEMQPCDVSTNGNTTGQNYYLNEFNMGINSGKFVFEYFTDGQADEMIVYCGRKNTIGTRKEKELFRYFEATGSSTFQKNITFSGCQIITVVVKGSSHWNYTVNCPN